MNLEEMDYDAMSAAACAMFGFTPIEVKENFKTDDELRNLLKESKKGRGVLADSVEEDKLGWDSIDSTSLDDDAKRAVESIKLAKKKALSKSIASIGKVSESDVRAAMKDINASLASDDTEED